MPRFRGPVATGLLGNATECYAFYRACCFRGDFDMAKQGMARPDRTHTKPKNDAPPVPEIQGKAKHGKTPAKPIVGGTGRPEQKVYHQLKGDSSVGDPHP